MGAYKWYKGLPPWGKGVAVVFTLGSAAVVIWKGYSLISNAIAKSKAGQTLKDVNKDLDNAIANGMPLSYSPAQYKIWADRMESCYQGWGTCSGDNDIINSMKNDADILMLIKTYGVRTISSGKWNPEPDLVGDLPAVFQSELDQSDINSINATLSAKGIKYRF